MMVFRFLISVCLTLLQLLAMAQQPHPILESFEPSVQPNGILLKWVIIGGNQCQGTKVFRAQDNGFFEQIGHIPGICGSNLSDETYTYFDSIPFGNSYNNYKLEMGFQGFTDVVTVFFEDLGASGYALLSDPQYGKYRVLYGNSLGTKTVFEVFDRLGKLVHRVTGNSSDFVLYTSGWPSGLYVFRISDNKSMNLRGKIYIGI